MDCGAIVGGLEGLIAFRQETGQAAGISLIEANGDGFREVVLPGDDRDQPHFGTEVPRWTADGQIVFSSNRSGGPDDWHIFTVDPAGGEPRQLTDGTDGIEYHGVLSPDGEHLVYGKAVATPRGPDPYRDAGIFVSDADGANERQLTNTPEGGIDEHPDVSPDGLRVAFTRVVGQTARSGALFVVDLDGTGLMQLTDPELDAVRPRWSPDGRWIMFSSNSHRFGIESANSWLISADGTGLRELTQATGTSQAYFPDWSADGKHFVYLNHVAGSGTLDLAVLPVDESSAPCVIWRGTSSTSPGDPDWSPAPR